MVSLQQHFNTVVSSLLIGFLSSSALHADVLHVGSGQTYTTITAALSAADSGDEIVVHDGTYTDANMSFGGESIILRSLNGPAECLIQSTARAFTFSNEVAASVVKGFTIEDGLLTGSNNGGAMSCTNSYLTIRDCVFTANTAPVAGAVYCSSGAPLILNCVFTENHATTTSTGGGAIALVNCNATILNCTFTLNDSDNHGGAILCRGSSPTITNCVFAGNVAASNGGAISAQVSSQPKLTNCTLIANSASSGLAIYHDASTSPTPVISLSNCIVGCDGTCASSAIVGLPSGYSITYSDLPGGPSIHASNIDADPEFMAFPGPDDAPGTDDDDLRLSASSPCRDAGNPSSSSSVYIADYDSDGSTSGETAADRNLRSRMIPTSSDIDMGAFEYRCVGELDEPECIIDASDLDVLFAEWIKSPSAYADCPVYKDSDLDADCDVDLDDLVLFFQHWGPCPACTPEVPDYPTFSTPTWERQFGTPASSDKVIVTSSGTATNPQIKWDIAGQSDPDDVILRSPASTTFFYGGSLGDLSVSHAFSYPSGAAADPGGYDVTYTITNPTTTAKELPDMYVYGHEFAHEIVGGAHVSTITAIASMFGTHFKNTEWVCDSPTCTGCIGVGTDEIIYPRHNYAPVTVVRGTMKTIGGQSKQVAMGVSIKYPVLDYQHDVMLKHVHTDCMSDKWVTRIMPGVVAPPPGPVAPTHPDYFEYVLGFSPTALTRATIGPGETRTYVVSFRYVVDQLSSDTTDDDWVHTLKPYREHLWSQYGNVPNYAQNLEPIWGWASAFNIHIPGESFPGAPQSEDCTPASPLGFRCDLRIDTDGWDPAVDYLSQQLACLGHERFIMWTPSGLYDYQFLEPEYGVPEYPSIIMRNWQGLMLSTDDQLARFADPNVGDPHYPTEIEFGYWWGNSARVPSSWDWPQWDSGTSTYINEPPDYVRPLDPNDAEDTAEMLVELELAAKPFSEGGRGAKLIGLDSMSRIDLWHSLPWVSRLQELYPDVVFAAEPSCADLLHQRVPFAVTTDLLKLDNQLHAPVIADYLTPGREIWLIVFPDVGSCSHASVYTGWGLTVVNFKTTGYTQIPTADFLDPYVSCAAQDQHNVYWATTIPSSPLTVSCGTPPACNTSPMTCP